MFLSLVSQQRYLDASWRKDSVYYKIVSRARAFGLLLLPYWRHSPPVNKKSYLATVGHMWLLECSE